MFNRKIGFCKSYNNDLVVIAQWLAWRFATGKVPGSNPGKSENFSVKLTIFERKLAEKVFLVIDENMRLCL